MVLKWILICQKLFIMSRILSYPQIGTLKLYQINNHVHISALKQSFKDLFPNTPHKTTYKLVEKNKFIPLKHVIDKETFPFVPEDDKVLIRALQVFQNKLNIPIDTRINIEAKRSIIENNNNAIYWKTFGVSKVGIINICCKNIHNVEYEFRNTTNKNTLITLSPGQMIGYDEDNIIEHTVTQRNIVNKDNVGVYDQLIFTV
jgi:hypothetical protein